MHQKATERWYGRHLHLIREGEPIAVSAAQLVRISASADEALIAMDLASREGPSEIRLYVQGFG